MNKLSYTITVIKISINIRTCRTAVTLYRSGVEDYTIQQNYLAKTMMKCHAKIFLIKKIHFCVTSCEVTGSGSAFRIRINGTNRMDPDPQHWTRDGKEQRAHFEGKCGKMKENNKKMWQKEWRDEVKAVLQILVLNFGGSRFVGNIPHRNGSGYDILKWTIWMF